MDKKVTIITGRGGELGTGHLQRMLSFVHYSKNISCFDAKIYSATINLEDIPQNFITDSLENSSLIIRDMRDSTSDEIKPLKEYGPVLVIDDLGEGAIVANHSIFLLPNRISAEIHFDKFLYGYNFYTGLQQLQREIFYKDIDFLIYAGFNPPEKIIRLLRELLPGEANSFILLHGKAYKVYKDEFIPCEDSYPEIMLRAKNVITHFGVTLFEANISGCNIIAFNPSKYHEELTATVAKKFNIYLSCEYEKIVLEEVKDKLLAIYKNSKKTYNYIAKRDVVFNIESRLECFTRYIENLL